MRCEVVGVNKSKVITIEKSQKQNDVDRPLCLCGLSVCVV